MAKFVVVVDDIRHYRPARFVRIGAIALSRDAAVQTFFRVPIPGTSPTRFWQQCTPTRLGGYTISFQQFPERDESAEAPRTEGQRQHTCCVDVELVNVATEFSLRISRQLPFPEVLTVSELGRYSSINFMSRRGGLSFSIEGPSRLVQSRNRCQDYPREPNSALKSFFFLKRREKSSLESVFNSDFLPQTPAPMSCTANANRDLEIHQCQCRCSRRGYPVPHPQSYCTGVLHIWWNPAT